MPPPRPHPPLRITPLGTRAGLRHAFLAALIGLAPLLALAPLRAAAQPVLGVVVEQGTGTPVPGAMVMLFDDGGDRVDRMLTNAAGGFDLDARVAGPHYMTVERIGYASLTTDRFVPGSGDAFFRLEVPVEPVALDSLDVEAGRRCEVRPEEGRVTARVWEEVRKALAAEAWTREAALYRYTLLRFERTLDRDARELIADSTEIAPDRDAAFYSVPVAELADKGFVQAEGDSSTVYFAPDAGALLSDAFLDTHCLSVRDGGDGRIGLMFQPIPERFVPDIAGVLWLDAATAELDRLEFFYVNLLRSREIGQPGGEVTFARLPSGAWIVSYWRIRMPRLEERSPWRIRRVAYREEGGITQAITDARGRTVLDAASATIFGVVTDSTGTGPPSELVAVEIVGTGQRTTPDDDGAFLFSGLATGRHVLRVQRVLFSRWGLASPELAVEGEFGEVAYARLRVPSVADALAASCGGAPRPEGTAAVLGRIIAEDGRPVGGMEVTVRWPAATGYEPGPLAAPQGPAGEPVRLWDSGRDGHYATVSTTTDDRGLFLLCDVPDGSRMSVAVSGPRGSEPVVRRTFFIPPGTGAVVETVTVSTLHDIM